MKSLKTPLIALVFVVIIGLEASSPICAQEEWPVKEDDILYWQCKLTESHTDYSNIANNWKYSINSKFNVKITGIYSSTDAVGFDETYTYFTYQASADDPSIESSLTYYLSQFKEEHLGQENSKGTYHGLEYTIDIVSVFSADLVISGSEWPYLKDAMKNFYDYIKDYYNDRKDYLSTYYGLSDVSLSISGHSSQLGYDITVQLRYFGNSESVSVQKRYASNGILRYYKYKATIQDRLGESKFDLYIGIPLWKYIVPISLGIGVVVVLGGWFVHKYRIPIRKKLTRQKVSEHPLLVKEISTQALNFSPSQEVELAELDTQIQQKITLNHLPQIWTLLKQKKTRLEDIFIKINATQEPARADNIRKELNAIDHQLKILQG